MTSSTFNKGLVFIIKCFNNDSGLACMIGGWRGALVMSLFKSLRFFSFFFKNVIYLLLLLLFWLCWVIVAMQAFVQLPCECRLLSSSGVQASRCGGFSCGAQALGRKRFCGRSFQALEHRLDARGLQALRLHGMWDLPRSGIKPCFLNWQVDSLPLSE